MTPHPRKRSRSRPWRREKIENCFIIRYLSFKVLTKQRHHFVLANYPYSNGAVENAWLAMRLQPPQGLSEENPEDEADFNYK
jgi:hypothetical protein